ncbi:SulP family inorganic anion transporter [Carboxylicivirga sp. M1479]|uniref:SulP family inorganic anion transporter n=1 Tax=Carboxylicivirga sp. M1479 TaxID=2594476 RepID=UPI0011789C87|nr:SulP family inorganic anion transporter [Carboxylicivirga sp. M1479]TRX66019.1 SulP family inorganic anion transporter [Carboxylicivirga sp. M1479]
MVFLKELTQGSSLKNELLSGITVAIALVPEAIAFSFIAGVDPLIGLYAACIMGFFTSLLGGRPGMISGATGAIAVVVAATVHEYGEAYLYPTIILGGIMQLAVGALRLGKFIRLVPHSVMLGFVNGLAIVIFASQFPMFGSEASGVFAYYNGSQLYVLSGLVALTIGIMVFLPRFTKAIPSALVAILVVAAISFLPSVDTPTVMNLLKGKSMQGGLPSIFTDYPADLFSMATLKIIFLPALSVAGVGLIESLLTLTIIDERTDTRGSGNRESMAQGVANCISGVFGSMGGCAMIGQSMININSGARGRLSGLVAALTLLAFIMFLSPVIEQIPVAALIGVMFMVAYGTFEWSSIKNFKKTPLADFLIMVIVAVVTVVFHNLALAVAIGVVLSALSFAWDHAIGIHARIRTDENGVKHYDIHGPLFFGSTATFAELFNPKEDEDKIIVDFESSRVVDQSGIEAIRKLNDKYQELNKQIAFVNLSQGCRDILATAKIDISINPDKRKFMVVYDA